MALTSLCVIFCHKHESAAESFWIISWHRLVSSWAASFYPLSDSNSKCSNRLWQWPIVLERRLLRSLEQFASISRQAFHPQLAAASLQGRYQQSKVLRSCYLRAPQLHR